jgi:uncharacterized phiE125 gp8 family phage protein
MRIYSLDVVTPPAALPVSLEEFTDHARLNGITVQRQPEMLNRQLAAATRRGEEYCRRSFLKQTLRGIYVSGGVRPELIQLPRGKVIDVVSVSDPDGAVIDPAGYMVNLQWGTVTLMNGGAAVSASVDFISGYGENAVDVPEPIREGILEYATVLYGDRRGSREIKATADIGAEVPPGVEGLWGPFKIEV